MQQDLAVARRGVGAVGHGWCATLLESVAQTCRCREVVLARLEVKKQAGLQDTCRALQCPRRVVRDVSKCEGPSNWVGHPRRAATLGSGDCFVRHSFIEPCTGVCRSRPAPGGDARLRGVSFAVGVVVVLRAAARWTTSLPRRMSWRPTCARTRRTQLCWRILRPGLSVQGGGGRGKSLVCLHIDRGFALGVGGALVSRYFFAWPRCYAHLRLWARGSADCASMGTGHHTALQAIDTLVCVAERGDLPW